MDRPGTATETGSQRERSEAVETEGLSPPHVETEGTASEAARPSAVSAVSTLTEFPEPAAPVRGPFPAAFHVYSGKLWSFRLRCSPVQWESTPLCCLAEHEATPLYAISFHPPCSSRPDLVLHNGPSPDNPPLATFDEALGSTADASKDGTITLPALPNSVRKTTEEPLKFKPVRYQFSIEVETGVPEAGGGDDGAPRREKFEWRRSRGNEVLDLDGGHKGWKLVRLDGEAEGIGGKRAVRDAGTTSDGKEIVAAFSDNHEARDTKLVSFRFLGIGAAGHLGPRFAVIAVITALRIWNEERPYRKKGIAYMDNCRRDPCGHYSRDRHSNQPLAAPPAQPPPGTR